MHILTHLSDLEISANLDLITKLTDGLGRTTEDDTVEQKAIVIVNHSFTIGGSYAMMLQAS